MTWGQLSALVEYAVAGWFFIIAGFVLVQMLSGKIVMTGMLGHDKYTGFAFHRLQLLVVTVFFAGGYLVQSLTKGGGDALPNVPTALLLAMVGSHGVYLGGKFGTRVRGGSA